MKPNTRKITINVPEEILKMATQVTGRGITETIIEGLQELEKREKRTALRDLRGKVKFLVDLEATRG